MLADLGLQLSARDTMALAALLDPHGGMGGHVDYWGVLAQHVLPALKRRERRLEAGGGGAAAGSGSDGEGGGRRRARPPAKPREDDDSVLTGGGGGGAGLAGPPAAKPSTAKERVEAAKRARAAERSKANAEQEHKLHRLKPARSGPEFDAKPARGSSRKPPAERITTGGGGGGAKGGGRGAGGESKHAGGLGRAQALTDRVAEIAGKMDPRTAPPALRPKGVAPRPPMGLYDLQTELESVLRLALPLTETNALVRQFSR